MSGVGLLFMALFGLVVGSFCNVVIYRLPRRLSPLRGRSHCPSCGSRIEWWQNIPVVSWLALRGRCASCKEPIPVLYPVVESLVALLFIGVGWRYENWAEVAAFSAMAASLVCVSFIDLDWRIIPRAILYPASGIVAGLLAVAALSQHRMSSWLDALAGGAIGFGVFYLIHAISPRGMGFGDVRLAGFGGFGLGYLGLGSVAVGLMAAFALGGLAGLGLIAAGRANRHSSMPFGPALATGIAVGILWGPELARAWLG